MKKTMSWRFDRASPNPKGSGGSGCFTFVLVVGVVIPLYVVMGILIAMIAGRAIDVNSVRTELMLLNKKIPSTADLPANQMELTSKQLIGTIENTHQVSARIKYIMDRMEPNQVLALVGDLKTVSEKVADVLRDEGKVMRFMDQMGNVSATKINSLLDQIIKIDFQVFNELIAATKQLENKFEKLKEIKINL
mgnify:CR=1 FL=1